MTEILPTLPWPLSFLQLNDYINCPLKTYHKHVAKTAIERKSGQQGQGIEAHDMLKRRIKLREPLPAELVQHEPAVQELERNARDGELRVELALGCTANGGPCSFFDPDCRLRGRVDVCLIKPLPASHWEDTGRRGPAPGGIACIVDWKTGKPWEDPLELKIQGLLLKIHNPELIVITAGFYWLRENRMGKLHDVSDVAKTWDNVCRWGIGLAHRIQANDWPPDENPLCPWCPCSKQQCQFKKDKP